MISATVEVEPPCPEGPIVGPTSDPSTRSATRLVAVRRPFDSIPMDTWEELAARNPWATPFSGWAFQRAWWDAYGAGAEDDTVVVVDAADGPAGQPLGIIPLMRRAELDPSDAARHTSIRHGTAADLIPVAPNAEALFFGASYHADYATVLAAPDDLEPVADAVASLLLNPPAGGGIPGWDVVDLRRLRCGDPAADVLADALRRIDVDHRWTVDLEREDVCPVSTISDGVSGLDDFLATLGKKVRHEIRRKVRRAEAVGPVVLTPAADPLAELDAFIDLHQRRWGADGLFPPTPGGQASRTFIRRLFELHGGDGSIQLCFLSIGGRRVAAGISFEDGDTLAYYNAGVDPDARDLSPGVLMIARYVERAIATGRRRVDFLRGDEPYKYEWGSIDEPIQRLLVRRRAGS